MNKAVKNNPKRALKLEELPPRLRVDQVALHLGCAESHVLKLIASGKLKGIDLAPTGSLRPYWRVNRDDLKAFIESRKL